MITEICRDGFIKYVKVKIKVSRYRPEQALGASGRLRLRIFMTFGTIKAVRLSPVRTGRLSIEYVMS